MTPRGGCQSHPTMFSFRDTAPLFSPRSVAVVGASQNPSFVTDILRNLAARGFGGKVVAVNPRYREVHGVDCYPRLVDVPHDVDLVVVGVASSRIDPVLADCEHKRVRGLVVVSSGFADQGDEEGMARQGRLAAWAGQHGVSVCGPNCLGLLNAWNGLVALPTPFEQVVPGHIGAILQSGMLAPSLLMPLFARGIGVSRVVTTGNQANLDIADYLAGLVDDESTRVIACYVEGIQRPDAFLQACELAAEANKPIVMIKAGRSDGARRAAMAHTGSLVGSDDVVDAVLSKHGVIRVFSIDQLIETAAALHARPWPRGRRVAYVSPSGGASSIASDLAHSCGLEFPQLSPALSQAIAAVVPEFGSVGNPLDLTGQSSYRPDVLEGAFNALCDSGEFDVVVWGRDFPAGHDRQTDFARTVEACIERYPEVRFLMAAVVSGHMYPSFNPAARLEERTTSFGGIPFLQGGEIALRAIAHLLDYAEFQRARADHSVQVQQGAGDKPCADRRMTDLTDPGGIRTLLAEYGIRTPREWIVTTAEQAAACAGQVDGPLAMKVVSAQVQHKTEVGGVLLGVRGADAVREGFAQIHRKVSAAAPEASITGVAIQEMAAPGVEMILGMTRDAQFGQTIAIGFGGIWVEILKDVQLLVPPLGRTEVAQAIGRLRGRALLQGPRGTEPSDEEALIEAVLAFTRLCAGLGDRVEAVEINPLIVHAKGRGATAVDFLAIARE